MESTKKDIELKQYISALVQNILANYKLINISVQTKILKIHAMPRHHGLGG